MTILLLTSALVFGSTWHVSGSPAGAALVTAVWIAGYLALGSLLRLMRD